MLESYPILTLLPPLVAIILVIITKKVLISLGSGIVAAALVLTNFNPLTTIQEIAGALLRLVWADGEINWYTILIVAFLFQLGVLTAVMMMSGGASAITEWAAKKIKNRRGAGVLTGLLGMLIFIDDYFNALAVGQVARPITDRYRISRAKLAYLIDSSSAPVVVLMPLSSWGATIIGIMAPLLAASGLAMTQMEGFLRAAAMNFYAIAAIVLLWLTISLRLDFGSMRTEEKRAIANEGLQNPKDTTPEPFSEDMPTHEPGAARALLVPFAVLVVGVLAGLYLTGVIGAGSWDVMSALEYADVAAALNIGGIAALIVATVFCLYYTRNNPTFGEWARTKGALRGGQSMVPAILILLTAWVLGDLIGALGTGEFLASLVEQTSLSAVWLVPALFVIGALIAFATGTSWGSFGILLPLAGEMMNALPGGDELLIASFGAVLAGAVWGDHSSPISDTTILSSTGAACSVAVHVATQLPYAFVGAVAALTGYVVFAMTLSGLAGLATTLVILVVIVLALLKLNPPLKDPIAEESVAASH